MAYVARWPQPCRLTLQLQRQHTTCTHKRRNRNYTAAHQRTCYAVEFPPPSFVPAPCCHPWPQMLGAHHMLARLLVTPGGAPGPAPSVLCLPQDFIAWVWPRPHCSAAVVLTPKQCCSTTAAHAGQATKHPCGCWAWCSLNLQLYTQPAPSSYLPRQAQIALWQGSSARYTDHEVARSTDEGTHPTSSERLICLV
jgi:hypothetical protein